MVLWPLHSLTEILGWVTPCDLLPNLLNSKKWELILGHKIQYGYHPTVQLRDILEFSCNIACHTDSRLNVFSDEGSVTLN